MNDTKSSTTTTTTTSPTSSQDAAKMIYHVQAQFQQEKGMPRLPQMRKFGMFSSFDGIGLASCDGSILISNDSRLIRGHRMVLQEMENDLKPRLRLAKAEIRRRVRERYLCFVFCVIIRFKADSNDASVICNSHCSLRLLSDHHAWNKFYRLAFRLPATTKIFAFML